MNRVDWPVTLSPSYSPPQRQQVVPVPAPVAADEREEAARCGASRLLVEHQLASKKPSRASSLGQGKAKKFADDDNVDDGVDDAEEEEDDKEEPQTDGGNDGGEYVDEEEVEIAIATERHACRPRD